MAIASKVSVVIPAYNEVQRITTTIRDVQGYFRSRNRECEVIVAADGTDGTREAVAAMARTDPRISVIGHARRLGKGHGVRDAVRLTTGEIVGFVDADNKTPIEEFDKFSSLLEDGYDLVVGSRGGPGSVIERRQPLYRRVGSRGFAVFLHIVLGLRDIPDTQCGFKFFQRAVAMDLFTRQRIDGYMFDIELLCLAKQSGYRIGQVPVRWRDDGDSRLQLIVGNARNVADVFRIRFSRSVRAPTPSAEVHCSRQITP